MVARAAALRVCGLALAVFLALAVPFHRLCAGPYARAVLAAGSLLAELSGPTRQIVTAPDGRRLEVDRRGALREFFADPAQRPRAYSVLALWSWLAVAPLASLRRRAGLGARATLVVVGVYALALACNAVAWYWRVLAAQLDAGPGLWALRIAALDGLGTVLSMVALFVLPLLLALDAYPGLAFEPAPGRPPVRGSGARVPGAPAPGAGGC